MDKLLVVKDGGYMNSRIKFLLVVFTLTTLTLAACQPQASTSVAGTWVLFELNGNPVGSESNIILVLDKNNLSGSDGCNHLSGTYSIDGDNFSVGEELISTVMACEESIMQLAGQYTQALQASATYKLADNQLQLLDENDTVVAIFEAQSQELAGTSWLASYVNTGSSEGVVSSSSIQAAQQTLFFDNDGKINGNAGCNDYFANYEVNGDGLSFSAVGSTKMFCGESLMAEETAFLEVLEKAATYKIFGNSLEIRDATGNTLVTFTQQ